MNKPTQEMINAGAQRLLRLGELPEEANWLDEFSALQIISARNDAERVWLSMSEVRVPEEIWESMDERDRQLDLEYEEEL